MGDFQGSQVAVAVATKAASAAAAAEEAATEATAAATEGSAVAALGAEAAAGAARPAAMGPVEPERHPELGKHWLQVWRQGRHHHLLHSDHQLKPALQVIL